MIRRFTPPLCWLHRISDDDLNQLLVRLYGQANPHVVYRVLNDEFARLSNMLRDPVELVEFHVSRFLASA